MSDGGEVAVRTMSSAARRDGVDIRTGYRVQRVIRNEADEIVGVEANGASGKGLAVRARKAVIFATGGFTHDVEMRKNFLSAPVFGGCAAVTNEGDFVNIGSSVGAQLRNMNYAWMCPIVLEKALNQDPSLIGTFSPSGDSMIYVSKHGVRVANEKLAYNELAQTFFRVESDARRIFKSRSRRDLGPAESGPFGKRRVRAIHRSSRNERRPRHQRSDRQGVDPEYLGAARQICRAYRRPASSRRSSRTIS